VKQSWTYRNINEDAHNSDTVRFHQNLAEREFEVLVIQMDYVHLKEREYSSANGRHATC
jgi:hypothetical protein